MASGLLYVTYVLTYGLTYVKRLLHLFFIVRRLLAGGRPSWKLG